MASRRRKPSSTPIPKWILEKSVVYEKKVSSEKKQKSKNLTQANNFTNKSIVNIITEKAECTCGGENEKCFRCGGSGFYTRKIVDDHDGRYIKPSSKSLSVRVEESNFSNDSRGGIYGIREQGRFMSNPLYDDHD